MVCVTSKLFQGLGARVKTVSVHPTLCPPRIVTDDQIVVIGAWRHMSKSVLAADPAGLAEENEVDTKQAAATDGQ